MNGKQTLGLAAAAAAAAGFAAGVAASRRLRVASYTVESKKLTGCVRLAFVSDLHGGSYGEHQKDLLDAIAALRPSAVLFGGDILDDTLPAGPAWELLAAVGQAYPSYLVTGNHEIRRGGLELFKRSLTDLGIQVLDGRLLLLEVDGQIIQLCGADDPEYDPERFWQQLDSASENLDPHIFSVLLSHRPEHVARCLPYGFDLMLSGHAHGGQWRIPGLINGVFAPGQGLLPPYAGGLYSFGGQALLVSRGLARGTVPVPRVFNPPELVGITLAPAAEKREIPR